jgi:hypothetical protein
MCGMTPDPWDEWSEPLSPAISEQPLGCVGDLTVEEVQLDQLRQAVFERVEYLAQIPDLLRNLNATDWARWLADVPARIAVCAQCRRYVRMADATTLSELAWLGDRVYCHACAGQVLAAHPFTCEACGHEFHARSRPAPFAICPQCDSPGVAFAMSSLAAQLQRARKLNLPATLTPREWLDTLDDFGWLCAYCRRAEFACMDHFVPVTRGGGTTHNNCVPCCVSCNSTKGSRHPDGHPANSAAYKRVARYLARFDDPT